MARPSQPGRWFRFYDEVLDDPKVQTLPADDFKAWVNLLCIASRNAGFLPPVPALAFMLRVTENDCGTLIERLRNAGLIERRNGGHNGSHNALHGWEKRQYKSDSSTARVKRYRERREPVTETPPDTDTDTEAETEKKEEKRGRENAQADLAFVGRVVRLTAADFARWQKAYRNIPDMAAELTKADDFYSQNPPKDGRWFFPVSRWLEKAHEDAGRKPGGARSAVRDKNGYAPGDPLFGVL